MTAKACRLCEERRVEINRILKAYKKDKKIGLIAICVLIAELILTLAYGKDGILMLIDIIKTWMA